MKATNKGWGLKFNPELCANITKQFSFHPPGFSNHDVAPGFLENFFNTG
jgi:hypothetical protein